MQLVIAEKPSVARDLARVLGVPARGGQGVTAFEGTSYVITWCIGHLVELAEPADYDPAWKSWRLDRLPMLPGAFKLNPSKHAVAQLRGVVKLLADRRFAGVINACDAGREGELIFRYVYDFARSRLPIRRLWISSLTDDAIRRGIAAVRPGAELDNLADAARSRSEADWLVGLNATRAITVRNRALGGDALASIGRVQTPTLAMLVDRERELRDFVPQPYWEVRASLIAGGASSDPDMPEVPGTAVRFTATWRDGAASRIGSRELADTVVTRDTSEVGIRPAVVERVRASTQKEPPPQLFDLTSLQRTANRRFGFSAQRTLELAQALYERHKILTYPRTDSRHLSADVAAELDGPLAALAGASDGPSAAVFAPFAAQVLAGAPPTKRTLSRRFVDDAKVRDHHAIIPTSTPVHLAQLERDAARIYDLVARRFLGMFFPDAELAVTEVWIAVGLIGGPGASTRKLREATDGERDAFVTMLPPMPDRYLARGRVRTLAGWQEVAGIDARAATSRAAAPPRADGTRPDEESDDTGQLPILTEGQRLHATFAPVAKQTKPPPRYTEATLLGAMETAGKRVSDEALRDAMKDTGLGTPATRASIIETLLRRDYIARDRKDLIATPLGIDLIEKLPVASLASPELTGMWEARLAAVARGEETRAAFMADIARFVTDFVDTVRGALPPGMASAPPPPRSPPSSPPRTAPPSPPPSSSLRASPPSPTAPKTATKKRTKKTKSTEPAIPSGLPRNQMFDAPRNQNFDAPRTAPTRDVAPNAATANETKRTPRPSTNPPPIVHRPNTTNPDISIAATEWLAEAIMRMAPDRDGT